MSAFSRTPYVLESFHMKRRSCSLFYSIFGVCLFSLVPAFFVWNNILYAFVELFLGTLIFIELKIHGINKQRSFIAIVLSFLYILYILRAGSNIAGSLVTLLIIPLCLLKERSIVKIYDGFTSILSLLLIPSLLVYIYVIFLDGDLPRSIIEPKNLERTNTYYLYPFLVVSTSYEGLITRFMGYFDEPGVVGTITCIILIAEKFDLTKYKNVIFLISGIASMSLFFILMSFTYYLFNANIKNKIICFFITIAIVFLLKDNEIFDNRILSRFAVENGLINDNRTDESFEKFYSDFVKSPDLFWGLGRGVGYKHDKEGGSSYKFVIVDYGLIFFILYLFCFYAYAIKTSHSYKFIIAFSISFLGTMYQRPFLENKPIIFLILATTYIYNKKKEALN